MKLATAFAATTLIAPLGLAQTDDFVREGDRERKDPLEGRGWS